MKRKVTIADIAAEAGVSIPTVSKVLNKHIDVSSATRLHVESIIRERGYISNRASRPRRMVQAGLVDLMIIDTMDSYYFLEIIRGMEEALREADKHLVLQTMHANVLYEQAWINRIATRPVEGVVFIVLPEYYSRYLETLRSLDIPFTVIDDWAQPHPDIPSVGATNWHGGLTATEYLISLGHRRIATISGVPDHLTARARVAGFRSAMEIAGLPVDPDLVRSGRYDHQSGYIETRYLLDLPEPPTAIISSCDQQASGVYRALYERGITIPDEMSVIGFDDIPPAQWLSPPLTTIRQPLREMGTMATSMLLRQIAGEQLDTMRVELVTSLVVRESCGTPL
ncbi:LacI family transcriptional regulator [Dictyobacter sp. S3.2.2.5]|uniref:LacI family transcriptional regulator n=1 Tax=Dictyobacter halimunensis TaxID=3026934 RepID=A0ABQ6FVK2_9CHLR|nr:LacI family transcriptional regulator [Dictyobacter sp. S3.2.2.5]